RVAGGGEVAAESRFVGPWPSRGVADLIGRAGIDDAAAAVVPAMTTASRRRTLAVVSGLTATAVVATPAVVSAGLPLWGVRSDVAPRPDAGWSRRAASVTC